MERVVDIGPDPKTNEVPVICQVGICRRGAGPRAGVYWVAAHDRVWDERVWGALLHAQTLIDPRETR